MALPTEANAAKALAHHLDELDNPPPSEVTDAAKAALQMVSDHLGASGRAKVPDAIGAMAVTEAGAAVYYRRSARNGITTFGSGEVVPMRIAKDPMSTVYPILAPYAPPGMA